MQITEIFANAIRSNASDLFLSAGKPSAFRRYGEVAPCSEQIITGEELDRFRKSVIPPEQEQLYLQTGSTDAAYALTPEARFRINFFSASNGPAPETNWISPTSICRTPSRRSVRNRAASSWSSAPQATVNPPR